MTITITGEGINLYRILALRSAVMLEAKGLKLSRRSMTELARKELGLRKGTKRDDILLALDQAVEAQRQVIRPGDIVCSGEDAQSRQA